MVTEIFHEGKKISFHNLLFKGTLESVAEQIDENGLKRPTSAETASLVYEAFQEPQEKYKKEIIRILRDEWFWEFTGNLYLPKLNEEVSNGVILENNPPLIDMDNGMNKESLIKRLGENDPLVKFVPFGYKIGTQSFSELAKNPYVVARYGEEGAEKIAELASKYTEEPFLRCFPLVDRLRTRISALRSEDPNHNYKLVIDGVIWSVGEYGHASGIKSF